MFIKFSLKSFAKEDERMNQTKNSVRIDGIKVCWRSGLGPLQV